MPLNANLRQIQDFFPKTRHVLRTENQLAQFWYLPEESIIPVIICPATIHGRILVSFLRLWHHDNIFGLIRREEATFLLEEKLFQSLVLPSKFAENALILVCLAPAVFSHNFTTRNSCSPALLNICYKCIISFFPKSRILLLPFVHFVAGCCCCSSTANNFPVFSLHMPLIPKPIFEIEILNSFEASNNSFYLLWRGLISPGPIKLRG